MAGAVRAGDRRICGRGRWHNFRSAFSMRPQILIVGAGPTGLVLAIWLAKREISFRLIDKAPKAGTASRALVVHARTLEFYRQLGLDQAVISRSHPIDQIRLWVKQRPVGTVRFSAAATDVSAYSSVLVFPQDEHEALLQQELEGLGVEVERGTELLSFKECRGGMMVRLKKADGEIETCDFAWLAGCDGARSTVREQLGIGFPGGTYEHTFYVADITASGPVINPDLNLALDDSDFLAVFPLRGKGRARIIGTVQEKTRGPNGVMEDRCLQWSDVSQDIFRRIHLDIKDVNWFSTYRVHHRVASCFKKGRAFLLGDAAHVHSPLGGQGMNTGIGDAVNLGWKLEAVLTRGAPSAILDTYEKERIAFANRLVATTDRAFTFVNKKGTLATAVRTRVVPVILPLFFRSAAMRRYVFRTVSQTQIQYRSSALSAGSCGHVHAGDRLPWLRKEDNYGTLCALDWQAHFYGDPTWELVDWCAYRELPLHFFPPDGKIPPKTLCLVRPDGYIGWIGHVHDLAGLARYVSRWRIA